jgi:hypothetical protein
MPNVGIKPDGTLGWIDANGNEVNPDGSPVLNPQQITPLTGATPTRSVGAGLPPAPIGTLGGPTPLPPVSTPAPAPTPVPGGVDIAPGAQTPPAAQPVQPVPGVQQSTAQTPGGLTPGQQGPTGIPGLPGGDSRVDALTLDSRTALGKAYDDASKAYDAYNKAQSGYAQALQGDPSGALPGTQNASAQVIAAQNQLTQTNRAVETALNGYSTTLNNALQHVDVDPALATKYGADAKAADAQAGYYDAQAGVLADPKSAQNQELIARAGLSTASASAALATAAATTAKTPDEQAALRGQAAQAQAQATSITQQLPGLIAKTAAETQLLGSQAGATDAQATAYKATAARDNATAALTDAQTAAQQALIPGLAGQQAATTAQAAGAGAASQANAQATLAGITQAQQGPLYGLQDRVNAIRQIQQQVFGPGGSGDPNDANDLLNQYVTSSVAGTTPYAANVAAANAGLTAFGTQASMYNAAQQALASRGTALAGLGGNVLGTLAGINANAPAGSTAMAGAFKDVVDYMANKMAAAQTQGGPGGAPMQQPTAPQLPALLQRLAPGGSSAVTGAPGPTPMPNPAGLPTPIPNANPMPGAPVGAAPPVPTANPMGAQPQGTNAPVTINIGGQGQGQPAPPPGGYAPPSQQPGTYGQLTGAMPSMLQQYAPPTQDFVHQLWGNELQSGAVKSPYAAMQPQIPGPTPAPVMA